MLKELKIAKKLIKIAKNAEKQNELLKEYAELKNCDIEDIDSNKFTTWVRTRLENGEEII